MENKNGRVRLSYSVSMLQKECSNDKNANYVGPSPLFYELTPSFLGDDETKDSKEDDSDGDYGEGLGDTIIVSALTLTNYFVASITLKQHRNEYWETVLKSSVLMADPHSEVDAYQDFTIGVPGSIELSSKVPLRIYVQQPSPLWKKIGISNIAVFGSNRPPSPHLTPPPQFGGWTGTGDTRMTAWPAGNAGVSLRNFGSNDRNAQHYYMVREGVGTRMDDDDVGGSGDDEGWEGEGAALDVLCRALGEQMSKLTATDVLHINQAAAFLEH